jgi:hypothetical protein
MFFLFSYFAYNNQIWLNCLMDDCHAAISQTKKNKNQTWHCIVPPLPYTNWASQTNKVKPYQSSAKAVWDLVKVPTKRNLTT